MEKIVCKKMKMEKKMFAEDNFSSNPQEKQWSGPKAPAFQWNSLRYIALLLNSSFDSAHLLLRLHVLKVL